MAIQICFHSIYSHAQISPKIGPFDPYIGPNDPHGGIFSLGNICFHKLGSDRNLWVPLEFCHQGGAWGPLLPTRLNQMHISLICVSEISQVKPRLSHKEEKYLHIVWLYDYIAHLPQNSTSSSLCGYFMWEWLQCILIVAVVAVPWST